MPALARSFYALMLVYALMLARGRIFQRSAEQGSVRDSNRALS